MPYTRVQRMLGAGVSEIEAQESQSRSHLAAA